MVKHISRRSDSWLSSLRAVSTSSVFRSESSLRPENRLFAIRVAFWLFGTVLAIAQAWNYRYWVSADGISYLDLSDALSGMGWHRLINGTWSPLYPILLGLGRILRPDRYGEVVTGHLINIILFVGTFLAFEYLLCSLWPRQSLTDAVAETRQAPRWPWFMLGYSIFLSAFLVESTLRYLRPDILMALFLFVAMGLLIRICQNGATWRRYSALGAVLGVGYLAKQPMLPVGFLIIATSALACKSRVALPKALFAALLMLLIGAAYFVPLSKTRGYVTFGEASTYNYLVYVDQNSESAYLMDPGAGSGHFLHVPIKISDTPPTYSFSTEEAATHLLRYDPSYWTQGGKARFSAGGQIKAVFRNLTPYIDTLGRNGGLIAGLIVLCFAFADSRRILTGIRRQWPVWGIGLMGIGMYAMVHVEDRYTAPFFALFWLGLLSGVRLPRILSNRAALAVALAISISILVPLVASAGHDVVDRRGATDFSAEAARQLTSLGIRPADRVARISPWYTDYAWARMLRLSIIAEVDPAHAGEFWECGPEVQARVLKAMSQAGARAVVAHIKSDTAPPLWQRLGDTEQWIYWLN
jgi:hypothetical protein